MNRQKRYSRGSMADLRADVQPERFPRQAVCPSREMAELTNKSDKGQIN
jgi:hypothetical protein